MRKRLSFAMTAHENLRKKHRIQVTELRGKIKMTPHERKMFKQQISRNAITIQTLRNKLKSANVQALKKLRRKLAENSKEVKKQVVKSEREKYEKLLQKKDEEITFLHLLNAELHEKTEETTSKLKGKGKQNEVNYCVPQLDAHQHV